METRLHEGVALGVVLGLLLGLLPAAPLRAQAEERCFAETGFCISGRMRAFWEQNGGLAVFGLPLTSQQQEQIEGTTVEAQWFERHRIELHPENAQPYDVLLGRSGVELLAAQGRDWKAFAPLDPADTGAGCVFFAETRHQICGAFLEAFRGAGLSLPNTPGISAGESLALFGLPISEASDERVEGQQLTVQWFERARFELHPEGVLFGRLGAELRAARGGGGDGGLAGSTWRLLAFGPVEAPQPASRDSEATLLFSADGQAGGSTGCNSFGGSYTATASEISFGPLRMTLRACAEEQIVRQEQAILAALQGTVGYERDAELRIRYDGGRQQLVYGPHQPTAAAIVEGVLTYRERVALPPNAVCSVRLLDVSRQDAPAITLAEQLRDPCGQVPVAFSLAYDPAAISPSGLYGLRGEIRVAGELWFSSAAAYPVITGGAPTTGIELVLRRV